MLTIYPMSVYPYSGRAQLAPSKNGSGGNVLCFLITSLCTVLLFLYTTMQHVRPMHTGVFSGKGHYKDRALPFQSSKIPTRL